MKKLYISMILSLGAAMGFTSCDDLFEPAQENLKDVDQMYDDSKFAQGFLVNVYRNIPAYYDNTEYATDDAVTNETENAFRKMTSGSWTSANDPTSQWVNSLNSVQNLNLFLENVDKVNWADDPETAELFRLRTIAEARGLRALFMFYLLRSHSGITADGQLTGVPILDHYLTVDDDFNMPRASFDDCVKFILEDLDFAQENLPMEYESIGTDDPVPAPFDKITSKPGTYNRVMGHYSRLLINGLACRAIRSRVTLLAASPAYEASATTWTDAANAAAKVLDHIGGPAGIDANGVTYYCNTSELDNLADGVNPKEIIWRESVNKSNSDEEAANFPPSLYGNGRMNPTQNLVDAFPMANGYPISDLRGKYDAANPYAGRDPRLAHYIIYNGAAEGVNNTPIYTGSDATTADGLNKRETSTRTGYYMKKRLRMDVNMDPSMKQGKNHFKPRFRYTEIFLNYAEAANEVWGPRGNGGHSYSAYDVIKAIRHRALGIDSDPYLEECAANPDKMRELIRNERRLELCFESFRFWDLRRWKADLNEAARGMNITNNNVYNEIATVESRLFESYMYYGPIPMTELLKFSNLKQNQGW